MFNNISVWWNVVGVAVIVVILIAVPSHHASLSYVFGHRANESGFSGGAITGAKFWFYVLPLGFLLTMYTITGYDASAHVSEETHGAEDSAPKGVWRSVFYSAIVGWIVLLAITFAIQKSHETEIYKAGFPALTIFATALSSVRGQGRDPDLDRRPAVLRDGVRHERLADDVRVLARRRGARATTCGAGSVQNRTPTWAVLFVCVFALDHHDPGVLPQPPRHAGGVPRGHLDLGHRPLHRLHDPGVSCAGARATSFAAGTVDAREEVQMGQPDRVRLGGDLRGHLLLPFSPAGVPWESAFNWSAVNYAPLVTIGVMVAVTIWYAVSAKNTFKGPVRTIDELDADSRLPDIAQAP